MRLILHWLINAAALFALPYILSSVQVKDFVTALVVALVLGLINAIIRPVLVLFSIPLIVITLGLFLLLINIALLALTQWIVSDFDVEGFWTYVGSVIVLWVVNTAADLVTARD